MSVDKLEPRAARLDFEPLTYGDRYFVHTAKNSIVGVVQILGEAISNADEAITRRAEADGKLDRGEIYISYDPESMELTVGDTGDGMSAAQMEARLRSVGGDPQEEARRAFFHRGIREVFIAMGGGEITSIGRNEAGKMVASKVIFHPTRGMAFQLRDRPVKRVLRDHLEVGSGTGTRVTIPMERFVVAKPRDYEFGALEAAIRDCAQVRPVLADMTRKVMFRYADQLARRVEFAYPDGVEALPETDVLSVNGQAATMWAKISATPLTGGRSRQTRHYGILVRGARAAYEVSLGDRLRVQPAMQRIYGEFRLDAIEELQRASDNDTDDERQLVYQPDRSGLNPEHPLVQEIYAAIDRALLPIVTELETERAPRRTTPDMRRQLKKLAQVINHAVREEKQVASQSDPSGEKHSKPGSESGDMEGEPDAPEVDDQTAPEPTSDTQSPAEPPERVDGPVPPIRLAQSRLFVDAGESRSMKVWFADALHGEAVTVEHHADKIVPGITLSAEVVPDDGELELTVEGGAREGRHEASISVLVGKDEFRADLSIHVRFPRASGFISQIVPSEIDHQGGSATWDPATGIVTVYTGRPEFKAAARTARQHKVDPWKYPLFRQLVVESVREAALTRAAERRAEVEWDDIPAAEQREQGRFHELVTVAFQELDHELRAKLLAAFLEK